MKAHFAMLAGYNRWANERVYAAAGRLPEADFGADHGAFFHSLKGTLNHLLVTDRIWMRRFTGDGPAHASLDEIVHERLDDLAAARRAEDERIIRYIDALSPEALAGMLSYRRVVSPEPIVQPLASALAHLFNHQTHHRGQAHTILTRITGDAPSLDLIQFQRDTGIGMA